MGIDANIGNGNRKMQCSLTRVTFYPQYYPVLPAKVRHATLCFCLNAISFVFVEIEKRHHVGQCNCHRTGLDFYRAAWNAVAV